MQCTDELKKLDLTARRQNIKNSYVELKARMRRCMSQEEPQAVSRRPSGTESATVLCAQALEYAIQERPEGLAQSLTIAEEFLNGQSSILILGDNIFFESGLQAQLRQAVAKARGATVFAYRVSNPSAFGVVSFDETGKAIDIAEKPENPRSNYAVTGLYFYDEDGPKIARSVEPSARGELEITDVNNAYLERGSLDVQVMARGMAWLDTGTHDSLLEAAHFIQTLEKRQGVKIGCPEEIAWSNRWISDEELLALAQPLKKSGYGRYLTSLIKEGR